MDAHSGIAMAASASYISKPLLRLRYLGRQLIPVSGVRVDPTSRKSGA